MGYSSRQYERPKPDARPWKIHPIWRGIGCIMLILLPIMAYAGQYSFWRSTTWFPVPEDLKLPVVIPLTGSGAVNAYVYPINNLLGNRIYYADLFFFFVFLLLGFGLLSVLYGVFYRMVGPPRYGRYDAPPERGRRRRF